MKVSVSVKGRFHAFFLAQELQRAHVLNQLITSYPIFKAHEYGINKACIDSLLLNECLERIVRRLPIDFLKSDKINYFFHEFFDQRAGRFVKKSSDIFVAWSGSALHSIKRLQHTGMKIVLDTGSSHAIYQKKIMEEEYGLYGLTYYENPNMIEKKCQEYQLADYIALPSQFAKNSFLQHNITENKIIHVPYGVDITKFYPTAKPDKKFRIIFCGNASLRKGIPYLLQAFFELRLPNTELYIIGPPAPELIPCMKKYKADNIIWAGAFRENALLHEYAKGDVFCLPSIEDGFGLVIPQAMACGLPVICTTHTAAVDIITEGQDGFVIPIRNVDALKEKIVLLYENSELRSAMGKSALEKIHQHFLWEHYGTKMIAEYQRILGTSTK